MPANLTPEYYAAEEIYRKANTPEEKIEALQKMLAVIPKHKGTEKMQADLKKRIASLRKEGKKKKGKSTYNPFNIEKQGAGQVVLIGYPNTGKSSLVSALTRAKVKVADYPYATTLPAAGMMPFEDIYIQLVDTPPVTAEGFPSGLFGTFQRADALMIVVDSHDDSCLDQLEGCISILTAKKLIDISCKGENKNLPFIVIGNKADLPGSDENIRIIKELKPDIEILPVSSRGKNLDLLANRTFQLLDIIRIYSKAPGRKPDMEKPFTLKRGSTVLDFAACIHRDFPEKLKSAFVWGSARFDGQAVPRDYILQDKDIVEIQI